MREGVYIESAGPKWKQGSLANGSYLPRLPFPAFVPVEQGELLVTSRLIATGCTAHASDEAMFVRRVHVLHLPFSCGRGMVYGRSSLFVIVERNTKGQCYTLLLWGGWTTPLPDFVGKMCTGRGGVFHGFLPALLGWISIYGRHALLLARPRSDRPSRSTPFSPASRC